MIAIHYSDRIDSRVRNYIETHDSYSERLLISKFPDFPDRVSGIKKIMRGHFDMELDKLTNQAWCVDWLGNPKFYQCSFSACFAFSRSGTFFKYHKKHNVNQLQQIDFDPQQIDCEGDPIRAANILFGFCVNTLIRHAEKTKKAEVIPLLKAFLHNTGVEDFVNSIDVKPKRGKPQKRPTDVTLEFAISDEYLGSDQEYALRHKIEEALDAFLQEQGLGEVDGGSIGVARWKSLRR